MFSIKITANTKESIDFLKKKDVNISDYQKIFGVIKKIAKEEIKNNFDNEIDYHGVPLIKSKKKSGKTMTKTGNAYRDMQDDKNYQVTGDTMTVTSSVFVTSKKGNQYFYIPTHQFGLTINLFGKFPYTFPQRAVIGIKESGIKRIEKEVSEII